MPLVVSKRRKVKKYKPSVLIEVQKANPYKDPSTGRFTTGGGGGTLSIEEDLKSYDPTTPVPASPKNAGGVDAKTWDNWEHGPDGNQYVELYRQYAAEKLGLEVPKSSMDVGGTENYLTTRGYGGSSTDVAKIQSANMVTAIANGTPNQPALYRGLISHPSDPNGQALIAEFSNLQAGDTIDMPLVSTTRSLGVASWYAADRTPSGTDSVIMKIQPGAKGVAVPTKSAWYPQDHEVVTSGKFEVVGVTKVEAPYWKRDTLEVRAWSMGTANESLEILDRSNRLPSTQARQVYDAVSTGNYKSLETSDYKLTNDRNNNYQPYIDGTVTTLSSWTKQPPKTFTVVEVKMIEPHIIQKVKSLGMKFYFLFNDRPFSTDSSSLNKANPYKDPTTGRFTTGGTGAATTGNGEVNVYDQKREDEIFKERDEVMKEKRDLERKHKGLSPRAIGHGYTAEEEAKWRELDKRENDLWEAKSDLQQEYFDNGIEMKSGNSAAGNDFGFSDERFDEVRDEYVVPDELTLKTNAGLRRTGRVTTKVQRFDEMVAEGTVIAPTRVHRAAVLSSEQVGKLEVGASYVDRGFQSTAMDRGGAEGYLDIRAANITGEKVIFDYDLQPGVHAVNVGYGEIVVQRSAKVSITGVSKKGDITFVKAEVSKSE